MRVDLGGLFWRFFPGQFVEEFLPGVADGGHEADALVDGVCLFFDVGGDEEVLEVFVDVVEVFGDFSGAHIEGASEFCDDVLGSD